MAPTGQPSIYSLDLTPMRYCNSCHRYTAGNPLFCGNCASTYNSRLCPRLHVNPRTAHVCSQCGSRELSTPQHPVSRVVRLSSQFLSLLPGALLMLLSITVAVAFLEAALTNIVIQGRLVGSVILLALAWWAYTQLPSPVRQVVSRLAKRVNKRDGHR